MATDRQGAPERAIVDRPGSRAVYDLDRIDPPAPLAPYVDYVWRVGWDLGPEVVEAAVIPYPSVQLTLEWGEEPERHAGHRLPAVLVHGVLTRLFTITLTGRGGVLGLQFRPGGFAALFGVDVSPLTDRVVPAADVVGQATSDAVLALLDRPAGGQVDALIDLVKPSSPAPDRLVRLGALVDEMRDDPTLTRVEQLPKRCGWTVRTIQRVFRSEVGAGPKWVLGRYRMQEAVLALEARDDADLADLAVELGWFDQAHFTNEFRRVMGVTPGEYRAVRLGHEMVREAMD